MDGQDNEHTVYIRIVLLQKSIQWFVQMCCLVMNTFLETTELVIGALIKRRADAAQISNKFLQFHIAYTKVDIKHNP